MEISCSISRASSPSLQREQMPSAPPSSTLVIGTLSGWPIFLK